MAVAKAILLPCPRMGKVKFLALAGLRLVRSGMGYLLGMEAQLLAPASAPSHTGSVLYHGTSVVERGEAILRDGCLRAATREELDARYGKSFQRPVDGRVYLTTSLEYAAVYALGGYRAGHDFAREGDAADPYGYVFAVDGSGVSMVPDEDSLGSLPSMLQDIDRAPASILGSARDVFAQQCLLDPCFRSEVTRQVARSLTPHVAKKAADGMAVWQSKAGKALLRGLSPDLLARLTPLFPHRSAGGPLRWTAAWKMPKASAKLVRHDCSNLFEVATRIG